VNNVAMTEDPPMHEVTTPRPLRRSRRRTRPCNQTRGSEQTAPREASPAGRQVSLSVRTLLTSLAILVLRLRSG